LDEKLPTFIIIIGSASAWPAAVAASTTETETLHAAAAVLLLLLRYRRAIGFVPHQKIRTLKSQLAAQEEAEVL